MILGPLLAVAGMMWTLGGDLDLPGAFYGPPHRSSECSPWPAAPPCPAGLVLVVFVMFCKCLCLVFFVSTFFV